MIFLIGSMQIVAYVTYIYDECVCVTEMEWSDWGECSVTCGTGSQSRYSRCVDDGSRLELCVEAGGERTETRTCSREPCATISTTTEVSESTDTTQSIPDIFYPALTGHSPSSTVADRKKPQEHKHRKSHHLNAAANNSATNVLDWGLGKIHEQVLSSKGE
jgi:hypothetical protein